MGVFLSVTMCILFTEPSVFLLYTLWSYMTFIMTFIAHNICFWFQIFKIESYFEHKKWQLVLPCYLLTCTLLPHKSPVARFLIVLSEAGVEYHALKK